MDEQRRRAAARLQPKLEIGQPGDVYEREADRIAAAVVSPGGAPGWSLPMSAASPILQRQERPTGPAPPTQFPAQQELTPEHDLDEWKEALETILQRLAEKVVAPMFAETPVGQRLIEFLDSPAGKLVAGLVVVGTGVTATTINAVMEASSTEAESRVPADETFFGVSGVLDPFELSGIRIFGIPLAPPAPSTTTSGGGPPPAPWGSAPLPGRLIEQGISDQFVSLWLRWNLEHRDDLLNSALAAGQFGQQIDPRTALEIWLEIVGGRPVERREPESEPAAPIGGPTWVPQFKRDGPPTAEPAEAPALVEAALQTTGRPLEAETRAFMEARLGHDFGRVRVHADGLAAEAARAVGAQAYTVGSEIVFGAGQYAPGTAAGQRLLAHELAHVVQQRAADPRVAAGGARALPEREAGEAGPRFVGGAGSVASGLGPVRPRIQRLTTNHCTDPDAVEVQGALLNALSGLAVAIQGILSPGRAPAVTAAFTRYFGTNAWATVAQNLQQIFSGLPGATVECEYPHHVGYSYFCGGNLGYVRPAAAMLGTGEIHVCQPQFHVRGATDRVGTLVHEAAHRFLLARDIASYGPSCTDTAATQALSDPDRLANADCYACLIRPLVSIAPGTPPAATPTAPGEVER